MANSQAKIRALIDPYLLLQWCQENIVVHLASEQKSAAASQGRAEFIGHFSYLTDIGDFNDGTSVGGLIKQRLSNNELECKCIEKQPEEIQALHDKATQADQTQTFELLQRVNC